MSCLGSSLTALNDKAYLTRRDEKTAWGGGFFEGSVSWGTSEPW
ncbi:hypothetical protein NUKP71_52500 [Klebsiella quasipneumoniae]|nr:hypothetical protein TUM16664_05920 [Enterobacter cloacae]GKP96244.1 hypothetical protein NUKP71_52500 [Klebsiella quasipneumoniae]GMX30349.1 hypothetical protein LOCUS_51920 [Klebsiella pneumoniae]